MENSAIGIAPTQNRISCRDVFDFNIRYFITKPIIKSIRDRRNAVSTFRIILLTIRFPCLSGFEAFTDGLQRVRWNDEFTKLYVYILNIHLHILI